jgi:glycosyltransferase involved in cell wall biosynthesis
MYNLTFVSTFIPYPPDKNGFTENIFHIIQTLKKQFPVSIRYIAFYNQKHDETEKEFSKYVDELIFEKPTSKYLFPIIPLKYKKYKDCNMVFFCDFNAGYYHSIFTSDTKILYAADSPAYYRSKRKDLLSKLYFWKFIVEEAFLFKKFKKIIFVSDLDVKYSAKRTQGRGIQIPIGYNHERTYTFKKEKRFDLVFSGNFNYYPNKEAAEFFLNEIFEDVRRHFENITICFVGRHPSPLMIDFAENFPLNIVVTGEVNSVEEYLAQSKIYVSPLLSGSGMKNKILQAMAAKLPIVCTPESISGFSNYNSNSVIVCSNQLSLKENIINLLRKNNKQLEKLGQINQEYFNNNYSWTSIVQNYYVKVFNL